MGERNPLLKYLQAAGLKVTELDLFGTDEVKIIDIVDGEFVDITDEAEEYFVKDCIKIVDRPISIFNRNPICVLPG